MIASTLGTLVVLFCFGALAYQRASLAVWTISTALLLFGFTWFYPHKGMIFAWMIAGFIFFPLYANRWRQQFITRPILKLYRAVMPSMSRTERDALAAGTIAWEGDLFRGNPNWNKLLGFAKPSLTEEERAFIAGPVETLCHMTNDWDITQNRADLPKEMWQFLKDNGFFGFIIPKEYGGKAFSAFAHSQILTKIYGVSVTVATTVSVPNSLGPAELLLHYGTAEQKSYYLPRLARGEEIPCFALTGPDAGSDAGSMSDTGVVCWGEFQGKKTLGIRLNFNKRYITMAPVATLIGLAFKLYDPEHLLGKRENIGITCALIPRSTPGVEIGRRHFPVNVVFQNGPIKGKDVFIPIEWIIGGASMVGQGWRMLMECLAAGRGISLPASSMGGSKMAVFATSAYARIRQQFNTPIGRFEGIEEVLARMVGYTYVMDATRTFTANMIDLGERPALASAITKYHVTELSRHVANDAMDIHGGKGICLGEKNYLGRFYESVPIAITVEGANILTRSMIIFGQGAMRCHPFVFAEFEAAREKDEAKGLVDFDKAFFGHISYVFSNFIRTLSLGLTSGRIAQAPKGPLKRYFQQATRFSSAFAFLADLSLMIMGGSLKRKESISGRLGDILSYLYLLSSVLKHFHDQGEPKEDLPLVRFACDYCLYQIQERFSEVIYNFPNRLVASLFKWMAFPWGMNFQKSSDKMNHKIVQLFLEPTATRTRLTEMMCSGQIFTDIQDALIKSITAEPIEKIVRTAKKEGLISGDTWMAQAEMAVKKGLISSDDLFTLKQASEARGKIIAVDDFTQEELEHSTPRHAYH